MDKIKQREIESSVILKRMMSSQQMPDFDLGLRYLGLEKEEQIEDFVNSWFMDPQKFLKLKTRRDITIKGDFLKHQSVIDNNKETIYKFKIKQGPGRKVALLHIMHWNGRLRPYSKIISGIRSSLLPISTFIHVPAGRELNPKKGNRIDYEMISPNISKTVFCAMRDIHDIQNLALHLKDNMGFEQVGLFTYSVGSLRGTIASMMNKGLFDFGIFHLVADDFTESMMEGISTTDIANKIRPNIDIKTLRKLWLTISPGAYSTHFKDLPKHIRVVQSKYDYTFLDKNVLRFNSKLTIARPDAEIEMAELGHNTFGRLPNSAKVMKNNISFIYKNTLMADCKRSRFF